MRYLDTNIIIRYLTRDEETKAAACSQLLQRVSSGLEELTTTAATIAEATYTCPPSVAPTACSRTRSRRGSIPSFPYEAW